MSIAQRKMEEAVTNKEKQEKDPPNPVKIPEYCADSKKKDEENVNSHDKVIETTPPPVALAEGSDSLRSVDDSVNNSLDNASDNANQSVNNQAISVNVNYNIENQGIIDQEKEKCDPIDDADNDISQTGTAAMPSDTDNSREQQNGDQDKPSEEKTKEYSSNEEKSSELNNMDMNDIGEQPEQKDESQSDVVKEDNLGNTEVPTNEAADVATTETLLSEQLVDEESPEGKTEGDNATNTSNAEVVSSVDQTEMQKKEESASDKTKDIAESRPETTCDDEAGDKEKQPDSNVTTTEQYKDITYVPEGCQSKTSWYVNDKEEGDSTPGAEGYSTTVVGSVVVRKPLSSTSSEPKKTAKGTTTGSVFKKMSWGSIFGRKKSTQDKAEVTAAIKETPVHDGTDGVQEGPTNDSDKKESTTPVSTAKETKDIGQEVKESTEPLVENSEKTELEVPAKEDETKDISEGAIVPLEEGVAEKDEKTAQVMDDVPQEDEQKNVPDIEAPTDEDSLLRERIAKRESASSSHSPTKHMHMRMSYAEGTKEVEVIGTHEVFPEVKQDRQKSTKGNRLSCHALGEVDYEGWLTKRGGGALFASWKRKWVVLKEQQLYYYKTSFDPEAGGVYPLKDLVIAAAPEMKKRFCFKIQNQDPKSPKLYLAADNQDDMDRWIDVLSCASQGEVIVRKSQNQQADNTKMRKKTNSLIGKRSGSVLGLGGYYEYDGELEKTDQKRRASFEFSPKETQKNIEPGDKSEKKDSCESPSEDATPGDIKKLMTIQSEGDDVDASVAMDISATTPLKEKPCSPEDTTTVTTGAPEIICEEHMTTSNIKTEIKTSSSENKNEKFQLDVTPLEQIGSKEGSISMPEVMQSKKSMEEVKDVHVGPPSEESQKPQQPTLRTNTTWYYFLDADNDDWLDLDAQKADSDELLSLVRSIKDARVSIMGTPLPGNEERARALTTVSKENSEILKLKEMKRTLKDKERDLLAIEELFSKEVNRQSIHEWTTRYSHLTPEGEGIAENETIHENHSSTNTSSKNEDNVGVQDGRVSEDKLADGKEAPEVKAADNGKPKHDEGQSGGEVQDNILTQDYKPDDSGKDQIDKETHGKKTENDGEVQSGDMAQDVESQDDKTEDNIEAQHDRQTQGSEDITTKKEVHDKTNEVAMEPDKSMAEPDAEDKSEESTTQVSQEQVTTGHNSGEHTEIIVKKEDVNMNEKLVTTTDTVPAVQDQESLNTRL